jgi:hypothetical protein
MKVEQLEAEIKELKKQIRLLQDIEEIKTLQRKYGYYLEHWMSQEIVDLFADSPDACFDSFPGSKYLGKEGVVRYFFGHFTEPNPEFLHQLMQVQPVIDVSPDGKTAKGRWYGYGPLAIPSGKGVLESIHSGTYENEYVKENGKWKILKLRWKINYTTNPGEGFVKPDRIAAADPINFSKMPKPDTPRKELEARYPSGYIFPFHYKHPITGKETSEGKRNTTVKGVKGYENTYDIKPQKTQKEPKRRSK